MPNYIFITYKTLHKQVCYFDPKYGTCKIIFLGKHSSVTPHRPAQRNSKRHFRSPFEKLVTFFVPQMLAHAKKLLLVTDFIVFITDSLVF